jgi:cytochrome c oxidase subunit 2
VYGRKVKLATGEVVVADDAYIRESIVEPRAKVVAGYQPVMPTYVGPVSEEGIVALIAYVRTLGEREGGGAAAPATAPALAPASAEATEPAAPPAADGGDADVADAGGAADVADAGSAAEADAGQAVQERRQP